MTGLEDPSPAPSYGDPMARAVVQLTQITQHLVKEKKQDKSLEALLDGAGMASSSDSTSSTSSRKNAAVLRALKRALKSQPQSIYQTVERNMEEDFMVKHQLPGSAPVGVSARAWLEMRSRVQAYQTPLRLL